jgi:adenylate cyclase
MTVGEDASTAASIVDQAKRLRLAETLVNVSRTVAAMESLDDVLATLVELTTQETDADRGTLFL